MEGNFFPLRFPRLYILYLEKNILINKIHSTEGWNFRFRQNLNDCQIEDFTSLLVELEGIEKRIN